MKYDSLNQQSALANCCQERQKTGTSKYLIVVDCVINLLYRIDKDFFCLCLGIIYLLFYPSRLQ